MLSVLLAVPAIWSIQGFNMIAKLHKTPDRRFILAICDKNLIGKKFADKLCQLDLASDFYLGKELSEDELHNLLKASHFIHLVGKKSI